MFSSYVASFGLMVDEPRPLILRNGLHAPASLTRAKISTRATGLTANGVAWGQFSADQPRFLGSAGRLLMEGQRTNAARNPRAEGASAPSTFPLNWVLEGSGTGANGLALTVVGSGTAEGINYVVVEITGTTTSTVGRAINFETTTGIVAAAGETWTGSVFMMLEPGFSYVAPDGLGQFRLLALGGTDHTGTVFNPASTWQRLSVTRTLPSGTTNPQPRFRIAAPQTGVAVSTRWRIGWPQCEVGSFASSPILPAVGAPAISTRGGDLVAVPLTALGVSGNGACTLLWSGMVPQAAPAGMNQTLLQIDGGSDGTRIALRMAAGGTTLLLVPVTAGIEGAAVSVGSVVAGAPFRVGLSINGSGRVAASLNGAAAVVLGGGRLHRA